jgi:hypothetical protein
MAYDPKNLSVLAYANGFTLWHYRTPDWLTEFMTPGYFNDGAAMVRVGDMIIANLDIDNPQPETAIVVISKNFEDNVEVTGIIN